MGSSWSGRSYMGVGIRYEKQVPGTLYSGMPPPTWVIGGTQVGCHLMLGCLETPFIRGLQLVCTISPAATWPYHLIYCLCGIVGPWVKVPKALEEDTPMWVYGVGPAPGMSPKRHGLLGVSKLSVVKGWMGKSNDETNKHMHTCLT
ncbi:hypothetical protein CK203_103769 [Vitis vinifera]|uniref:Uncharacterized protein n=1 Tax=Vitis vinifera TaxID=29760 RepID=A0A438CI18_VITVI|nr:hypothetical protein CK203_103769 [Vitis vinifera]